MPLNLVHGPPNSGRAGLVRRRFTTRLASSPVLVVPTLDDVFSFEQELCRAEGALVGGSVLTFGGLFEQVSRSAGLTNPPRLSATQRLHLVRVAVDRTRPRLLARSARRPGFPRAAAELIEELQAALLDPASVDAGAGGLEESAYLAELAAIYRAYVELRDEQMLGDAHQVASGAIAALRREPDCWDARPVFVYGFDDLTREQLELVAALAGAAEVTVALTYEDRPALAARATLLQQLRDLGRVSEETTSADPANTESPLLFQLERGFLAHDPAPPAASDGSLAVLRSAGERGEAEAIGAEIAALLAAGEPASGIAVALRDPGARGPLYRRVLESYGVPVALEAEAPVAGTATGGVLLSILRAAFTSRRASDLLAYLRGPRRGRPADVDWLERTILRNRLRTADEAAAAWGEISGRELGELERLRAAADDPGRLLSVVAELCRDIAEWPLARDATRGTVPERSHVDELQAGAAIAAAVEELQALEGLEPAPTALVETLQGLRMRLWRGPVGERIRIASPYRLRAGRYRHLFVASLQDGEFPRYSARSPFLSDEQRVTLGLPERAETEAEERYLFYTCLSLPTAGLWLSCQTSDEAGGAEQPSPFLDDVRRMVALAAETAEGPAAAAEPMRGRGLGEVVFAPGNAPSEAELARSLAARGAGADHRASLSALGVDGPAADRLVARLEAAALREARTRAPGPLAVPAVLEALAGRSEYGGTTLETFAVCPYRWFVDHELAPEPLGPAPEPLAQGGLIHAVLERLYRERPGGSPLPRPADLERWLARAIALVGEEAEARELSSQDPADRAMQRRVERLLEAFLRREAARQRPLLQPSMLEAGFGEDEESEKDALDLGGWLLHGRIDRVDGGAEGGLVQDYKLSSKVTPCASFADEGKLQLPLYLLALRELWDVEPLGGLYQPLRATRDTRPRGVIREAAAQQVEDLRVLSRDMVNEVEFERYLDGARETATGIVARMRGGGIARDPIKGRCPDWCGYAPICRRERGALAALEDEANDPEALS